jgi:hypothetical protein
MISKKQEKKYQHLKNMTLVLVENIKFSEEKKRE